MPEEGNAGLRGNPLGRGLLAFVRESRSFVVVIISLYTLYVQIAATSTKNWDSTRQMGFAQPNYCNSITESYNVGEYNVNTSNNDTPNIKPLFYHSSNVYAICFSKQVFQSCLTTLQEIDTGNSIEDFTSLFDRPNHNYFPVATFTNALGFIILLLTILYETKEDNFVNEGAFFNNNNNGFIDRRMIIRLNHLLCVFLVVLLILSASYTFYLNDENCNNLYKNQASNSNYCNPINACGMTVTSIITPTDFIANNFRSINITFAVILTLTILLRCMTYETPPGLQQVLPTHLLREVGDEIMNRRIGDNNNDNNTNNSNNPNNNYRLRLELELALTQGMLGSRGVVVRSIQPVRVPNWKEYTPEEHHQSGDCGNGLECPICLSAITFLGNRRYTASFSNNNNNRMNRNRSGFSLLAQSLEDATVVSDVTGLGSPSRSEVRENQLNPDAVEEFTPPPSAASSTHRLKKIVKAQCRHIFHEYCIQEWFRNHDTCPVCRTSLHRQQPQSPPQQQTQQESEEKNDA